MILVEHLANLRVRFNGKQGRMRAIKSAPLSVQIFFDDDTNAWVDMWDVEVIEHITPLPLPG